MVISDEKKFIFFHIPKTGGSTVRTALLSPESNWAYCMEIGEPSTQVTEFGNPVIRFIDALNRDVHLLHVDYLEYLKSDDFKIYLDRNYFKFTFVREPYDRFYSAYIEQNLFYFLENDPVKLKMSQLDFNQFAASINEGSIRYDVRFFSYKPAHLYTHHEGKCMMNFIGKTENLEKDFKKVSKMLDLPPTELTNHNVRVDPKLAGRNRYKYLDKYEPETIALVNELYKEDFELFGYPMLDPDTYTQYITKE